MAELEINQSPTPQKGRIRKRGGGRTIHFFVQTQPSFDGEKMMIRVVDSAIKPPSLQELIPNALIRQSLEEMINGSSGLFLVTSSQKKPCVPLLYSLLCGQDFNPQEMATVEESITYLLPGMSQIEVDADGDKDYPEVLQSLVEKDKSRIMIDVMSNPSVARMTAEMASNGRLILTSLTAEDGMNGITLLREMITPSLLANSLIGVIHQHRLRRLCPACHTVHEPSVTELAKLGIPQNKKSEITFYQPRCLNETEIEQMRDKGRLCRQCNGEGYHGEVELYELLQITPSLKTAITQGSELAELQQIAIQGQKVSLMTTGLDLVAQGQISLTQLAELFPDKIDPSIPDETTTPSPTEVSQRITKVEELLISLTQEFNQLKQALKPTEPIVSSETMVDPSYLEQAVKTPQVSQELPREIDLSKETITADSNLYEELQDPGDWEALKRELDPNKETMIANLSSEEEENGNPFNSIADPWS